MLSTQTEILRISQGQLNVLERCPRQFQHTFLESLNSPSDPKQEEKQTLGSRFHLLMQQQEMGLPIHSFLEADSQLQSWMTAFANAAPEVLAPATDNQTFRDSEHYRTLQVQGYLLTVIYDLLIADNHKAQIIDWKTYPQPANKRKLAQNWQTRLYMYVLAETSAYLPENISMTYWFVQSEGKPQNIKFNYNSTQHQQIAKELHELLSDLTNWLERYEDNESFPQLPQGNKACNHCKFATRCERTQVTDEAMGKNSLPNLASIEEVSL